MKARLLRLYAALGRRFGPQRWWPGRTPYEVAIGAVLTQHTAWTNAARAVSMLRGERALTPTAIVAMPLGTLAALIRPAGTYRLKARRLKSFTRWLMAHVKGSFQTMRTAPLARLRRDLLGISGLGPETADAVLLYAAGRPTFVADAYVRRVLARHRLMRREARYERVREWLEGHLPSDPALFNEYHALMVAVGKAYCRATPRCRECPLRFDLKGRAPAPWAPGPARAHNDSASTATSRSAASGIATLRARSPKYFSRR